MRKAIILLSVWLGLTGMLSACGSNDSKAASSDAQVTVKIGILKNVTHAPGFIALKNGYFQDEFGKNATIEVTAFDNGSDFSTAMATNQIDIGYVGPGPAINQYLKSSNFRVIAGSNNGGAVLIAGKDAGIESVKDLVGKTVAVPTKGSTNEISLRLLLQQEGLKVTADKSGVQIITRAPADTLVAMRQKEVDATLIPEPWGTQMVEEGTGKVLVDWDKIPPNDGNYPLTILMASDKFLKNHRDLAKGAIKANEEAIDYIKQNPDKSYGLISEELKELSGKGMDAKLIKAALDHLNLTEDIELDVIETMAHVSFEAGYIKGIKDEGQVDLSKFIDSSLLDEVKQDK
ncbi:aliphatic sulfonate ABC transporter substrate-binding protein [Paenibacillus rhizovicinus]|uniref:Aliphatic sulfonate ABC transporter substrate-binding protein n=1 Tax=Paenibacillus rhizovicinus TaxID=2704463 RepID=A0A6C0NYF1_9BACL|nr:ABC transporter substrate-binding protein [Paenibacillus rhizovicinus]QHW31274.1 aliphatic sulfonate ABC transporter substrate-binding protein [Paenibacillus rhizovicinus]